MIDRTLFHSARCWKKVNQQMSAHGYASRQGIAPGNAMTYGLQRSLLATEGGT
jgi:hypothetical protein